jgi:hypothetical protein
MKPLPFSLRPVSRAAHCTRDDVRGFLTLDQGAIYITSFRACADDDETIWNSISLSASTQIVLILL